jgi:hypothetical protein
MRLRGHFIGALTLAFISIACVSLISAAAILRALGELSCIFPTRTPPSEAMTLEKPPAFLMEDPT